MALTLGNVVGTIGGSTSGGILIDEARSDALTGDNDTTVGSFTIGKTSVVGVSLVHTVNASSISAPSPLISVQKVGAVPSTSNYAKAGLVSNPKTKLDPLSLCAVLEPGTYEIVGNPRRAGRTLPLARLVVTAIPVD